MSNLSNKGDSVSAIDNLSSGNQIRLEQSFRTGRHSGGYSVTEIQAFIASITGSVGPWVRIHADNNNKPGTRLRSFTEVTGFANNSTASFTSSEGAITLNPNTKYWLVFGMTSADNSHRYRINNSNGNIDSCGELDWNIYDELLGAQYDTSDVRQRDHTDDPIMVAIIGSQVDNGSASELKCEDTSATTNEDITLTSNLDYHLIHLRPYKKRVGNHARYHQERSGNRDHNRPPRSRLHGGHRPSVDPQSGHGVAPTWSPKLKIHSDNNDAPGDVIHTHDDVHHQSGQQRTPCSNSPPHLRITLQPNTKYWLMFADEMSCARIPVYFS